MNGGAYRVLMLAALCCAVVASLSFGQAAPTPAVDKDLRQQESILTGEGATPEEREEAARKLVSRSTPEATRILKDVLEAQGNPKGQLAVARALVGDTTPDGEFVDPLFALMGPTNRLATDAAAAALANYKGNKAVLDRLVTLVRAEPQEQNKTVRATVSRTLGTMLEKRAAEALVIVLTRPDEPQIVRDAAADGLVRMTWLRENGRDAARWQQWWTANKDKSEDRFRLELVDRTSLHMEQVDAAMRQLTAGIVKVLSEQYQAAADKPATLMHYLKASESAIRATGVRIVQEEFQNGRNVSALVSQQLRSMVGDSSAEVRLAVASTLRALNDAEALPSLLAQVVQEPEPEVRAEIVRALGLSGEMTAAEQLVRMLDDKATVVVDAAVTALTTLPLKLGDANPELAKVASAKLKALLLQRGSAVGNQGLREKIVAAMAKLRDPNLLPIYRTLLTGRKESALTRVAALGALEALGQHGAGDLAREAAADENDASVRWAAVRALAPVASREDTELLWRRFDPRTEPLDDSVREAAWQVFASLLPSAPAKWLADQSERLGGEQFRNETGRQKLLQLQQALADRYTKDPGETKEERRQSAESLALTQQNIGRTLMLLKQPEKAAVYFKFAFDYWAAQPQQMVTEGLIKDTLGAFLAARKWTDACQFGLSVIGLDKRQQENVGSIIQTEAARLKQDGKLEDAKGLLVEATKLNIEGPLGERLKEILNAVEKEIQIKTGRTPNGGGPRSSTTFLWGAREWLGV